MTYAESLEAAWQQHLAPRAPDAPTVISTFAGAGGSSLGYSMAGYRELLAVEWDATAVSTFRANFSDVPTYQGDIAALSVEECLSRAGIAAGELDILDGSPPCQGFSTAGARVIDDPRNHLFREFVRLLTGLRPRGFVMENVSGLIKGKMRLVFAEMLRDLKTAGYRISARLLDAQYFGIPQTRRRLIFIGIRDDLDGQPSHPHAKTRPMGLRYALGLTEGTGVRRGWGKRDGIRNAQFQNKYRSLELPSPTLEATRPPILRLASIDRDLTLAECALVSGFPPSFSWSDRRAYHQIGNAVPPPFMRAIASHIRSSVLIHA